MAWTKQEALDEIDELIAEVDVLRQSMPHSAQHRLWLDRVLELLSDVFGRNSKYVKLIAYSRWQNTQPVYVAMPWEGPAAMKKASKAAFVEALDAALGTLQGARRVLHRASDMGELRRGDGPVIAPTTASPFTMGNIVVNGGTVNVGVTQKGAVTQTGGAGISVVELRNLADAFRQAVQAMGASSEEQAEFLAQVTKLEGELNKPAPLQAALLSVWSFMTTVATIEGTWQGWDRVQKIANDISVQMAPWFQGPQMLPNALT